MDEGWRGWAVGDGGTILATHDRGTNWTLQEIGTTSNLESVHFATPEIGWIVGELGTILATRDGGASWEQQSSRINEDLLDVHFATPEIGWVVGELGTILATHDGGAVWTPQESGSDQHLTGVSFAGPETGWAVGNGGTILATRDGGAAWTPQESGTDKDLRGVFFAGPETGWAVGGDGTILATRDGGATWTPQESGTERPLYGVHFAGAKIGWAVGGGATGAISATRDGGATWTPQSSDSEQELRGMFFAGPETGWAVGWSGTILATRDGGATWKPQDSGTDKGLFGVHFAGPETGWAVGKDGPILATRDGGATWTPQTSGTDRTLFGVHFAGPEIGWAVGWGGIILATRDGGDTWKPQTSGTELPLFDVHFAGPETGGSVGDRGTILATRDGGATWTPQTSGTEQGLWGVHFTGPETGWVVGDNGTILATRDGGQSWQQLENYRRDPAPWVYLAWLGAFGCLIAAARKLPADLERAPQSVADRLASDRPLELGDPDPLGYQRIAAGLSRFLRNEKTEPPLTVAITGEWGSGKSSLMNLLRADLERYEFRPVWFNAWHHQKEEHLFAALLEAVRGQAVPGWWSYAGVVFRWRLLRKRTRAHLFWSLVLLSVFGISLGAMVARWPEISGVLSGQLAALPAIALDQGGIVEKLGAWSAALAEGLVTGSPLFGLFSSLIGLWIALRNRLATWQLSPAKLMASIGDRTEVKALSAQLGFRHEFASAFREVCEALHPRTLTIIIDDLDRCRPEQVVETLEAVNFLVTAGPCYVILGIAPEQVMRCVGLGFKDIAAEMAAANVHTADEGRGWRREFAKNYLEKLINVEVPVPALTSEDARKIVAAAGEDEEPHRLERHGSSPWLAACFAVLFISALYVGANVHEWLQPPSVPEVVDTAGTAASSAANPTGTAATTSAGGEDTAPPSERPDRAFFREGKHADAPWWSWQVPLAGLVVLGGLVLLSHALRREDPVVRDSKDFSDALDIWVPVVLARTRSPRAVKRFVNRVRYYAMCEARREPIPTWRERLLELLGRRPRSFPTTNDPPTRDAARSARRNQGVAAGNACNR